MANELSIATIEHNLGVFLKLNQSEKLMFNSDNTADIDQRYFQSFRRRADGWIATIPSSRQSAYDIIKLTYESLKKEKDYCKLNSILIIQSLKNLENKLMTIYTDFTDLSNLLKELTEFFSIPENFSGEDKQPEQKKTEADGEIQLPEVAIKQDPEIAPSTICFPNNPSVEQQDIIETIAVQDQSMNINIEAESLPMQATPPDFAMSNQDPQMSQLVNRLVENNKVDDLPSSSDSSYDKTGIPRSTSIIKDNFKIINEHYCEYGCSSFKHVFLTFFFKWFPCCQENCECPYLNPPIKDQKLT